jgi:putative ABC transport system permease protein
VLSGLGIAIGIAAIVGVTGISASSRADLLATLDRLGTNLLTVEPSQPLTGSPLPIPTIAAGMVRRIPLVERAAAVGDVAGAGVRRSPYIPAFATGGLGVRAAEPELAATVGARLQSGVFLNHATARYPVVVLGATAAAHLGFPAAGAAAQVWLGDRPFHVIGVLAPVELAPELDRSVLVGWPIAQAVLDFDGSPSEIYVRTTPSGVLAVRDILARTAQPEHPEDVAVSRPSDALAARIATDQNLVYLLFGLGLVSLLVGTIGIANILLIGVLERRGEIGLRRALGATGRHIGTQFLVEAVVLGAAGGLIGCLIGVAVTVAFAMNRGWRVDLPLPVFGLAIATSIAVSGIAGLYPAIRAARLPPMEALRTQ